MRRRKLLAAGCACCVSALSGCSTGEAPTEAARRHPFAEATVAVRVREESRTDHDVGANARESLAYWAEHADRYAGFEVDFEVVPSDPDLTIAYVDSPDPWCRNVEGFSEHVLGCAPVLGPDRRVPEALTAYVVAGARPYGQVRTTTKHEIGHVLGLRHEDEPRTIMSNRPEDRIPMYEVRIDIWEAVLTAGERSGDGGRLYGHGVETWNEGRYDAAEAALDAAAGEFTAAAESLEGARERTTALEELTEDDTVALADLRGHLDRLGARAAAVIGFAGRLAEAAAAAARGDRETAGERVAEANEHVRAYNAVEPVELRDVAVALGLVRGFDRGEAVVDVDGEPVE
jgi:hypothetical protein